MLELTFWSGGKRAIRKSSSVIQLETSQFYINFSWVPSIDRLKELVHEMPAEDGAQLSCSFLGRGRLLSVTMSGHGQGASH
jgi:hypothetical protein